MHAFRTPDSHFVNLPDYVFGPKYLESHGLRLHYVDESGSKAGVDAFPGWYPLQESTRLCPICKPRGKSCSHHR